MRNKTRNIWIAVEVVLAVFVIGCFFTGSEWGEFLLFVWIAGIVGYPLAIAIGQDKKNP